ncbi:DoxX family protein [Gordonia caeni]|uniref:DoxX family protein n=1 Tax=Gordonia caeni TaxID=1007097 RepID=A0ABP7PHD7_9ACTN
MILRKIARPLLASAFIAAGVDALRAPRSTARSAQPLVDAGRDALPVEVADKLPENAATVLRINGAAQIGGGLLLATGRAPRFAAAALAGTLVPTTVYDSAFWTETDPALRDARRISFIKNVGLLGGVLIASADTEGKPSLAWRGRQKAHDTRLAVAAALPIGAQAGGSAWSHLVDRASDDAHDLGERTAELTEKGRERAGELAEKVAERAPIVADQARNRAEELAHKVADRAPVVAEEARERATGLAEKIADRAPVVAEEARDRATGFAEKIADRAPGLAEDARARAEEARDRAEQAGRRAEKAGRRAARRARRHSA